MVITLIPSTITKRIKHSNHLLVDAWVAYNTVEEHLTIITDLQWAAIVRYTQDNPNTKFKIICVCGHTNEGRLVLWSGPDKFWTLFGLL